MVAPPDLHDSAAAKEVFFRLRLMHPEIMIVWADSAYAGKLVAWAKRHLNLTIKTVSRPWEASGFIVLPHRWAWPHDENAQVGYGLAPFRPEVELDGLNGVPREERPNV